MEIVYAIILWITAQGNVTGVFEKVEGGYPACVAIVDMTAAKAAEINRAVVAKCTTDVHDLGRMIEEFELSEAP
jgi:hypothetical protein